MICIEYEYIFVVISSKSHELILDGEFYFKLVKICNKEILLRLDKSVGWAFILRLHLLLAISGMPYILISSSMTLLMTLLILFNEFFMFCSYLQNILKV
jgi:hypothetical protein